MSLPPDDPEATRRDLANEDQPTEAGAAIARAGASGEGFATGARFAPGTIVSGRFRVVNLVGAGGMGEVYRAEDLRLGQTVALKFVAPEIAHQPQVIDMLHREVRLGREVSHPNVARLHDIFDWDSHTFVSMEFIDGENLSSLLRRIGRLPQDKGLEIARGIARGLAAAHARGVLHRDLKPANIMIDGRGEAKITDFGIAVAGEDSSQRAAGTPHYMAPELLMGEPATARSDIYALGVVLWELFTGRRLWKGSSLAEIRREHLEMPPAPSSFQPDIEPRLEQTILDCLAADPADRPRSVAEVLTTLPGGDRLAQALAAGETPSPDAVVAAEVRGTISTSAGLAMLAGLAILLAMVAQLHRLNSSTALTDWSRAPLVLEDRALEIVRMFDLEPPPHHDLVMGRDDTVLSWLAETDQSIDRWNRLKSLPLYTVTWRGARQPMATVPDPRLGAPPTAFANEVEFDLQGRLRGLTFRERTGPVDPDQLIALTELADLRPVDPILSPPIDVHSQRAWIGSRPGVGLDERLEIGMRDGTPVWLEVRGPWTEEPLVRELPFATRSLQIFLLVSGLLIIASAGFFAWRNIRLARGDRSGALRIAGFTSLATSLALLIGASWPPWLGDRIWILRQILKDALYAGALIFVLYLALEPLVRRTWPGLLISWRRLLEGRWRDGLVGRDVLIGLLGGVAHSVLASATWLSSVLAGEPPSLAGGGHLQHLISGRSALGALTLSSNRAVFFGLAFVFLLSLFAVLTRRRWAAALCMFLLMNLAFYLAIGKLIPVSPLIAILIVGVMARFGLLSTVVMHFAFTATFHYPVLADPSRWFFFSSILPILVISIAALVAFRSATGVLSRSGPAAG